jgi:glutamate-1-semialdehyde 2,1-aminomutase
MTTSIERSARRSVYDRYTARTPRSAALFERATGALPGGSTRTTTFSEPYPPYVAEGHGATVTDVDGNAYLDFLGNYTSLILGHAHPDVVAAVEAQVRRGSAFAAPTQLEVELGEEIVRRVGSIERVRFTNSGTEATMFALRLARAHTGRDLIAKFAGAYHGTHDLAMTGSVGVPVLLGDLVVELPFNDMTGVARTLAGRERDVAAIIVEPIQGVAGMVPAEPAFLADLREFTRRHGILLVFDEVISFRVGPGGAQGLFGVEPDLTALGKIIGGGYPVGAFGGRAEVMSQLDARRPGAMAHGGTFNGNPVTAAAGLVTLRHLTPERYERLTALGDRLRAGLTAGFASAGLDARVTGLASLFQVHLGQGVESGSLATGRSTVDALAAADAKARAARFYLGMLLDGFMTAPRGMGALMTPLDEAHIDGFVAAAVDAAAEALEAEPTPAG